MTKTCNACGGAVCEVCGGCISHGECSCIEDQIQKYIDRAEVAEARLHLTEKNVAKILDAIANILPYLHDDKMEGETDFERRVLELEAILDTGRENDHHKAATRKTAQKG